MRRMFNRASFAGALLAFSAVEAFASQTIKGVLSLSDTTDHSGVNVIVTSANTVPSLTFWTAVGLMTLMSVALFFSFKGKARYLAPLLVLLMGPSSGPNGIPSAAPTARSEITVSDSDGNYEFDELFSGTWDIYYKKDGYSETRLYGCDLELDVDLDLPLGTADRVELISIPDNLTANQSLAGFQCCSDLGIAEDGNFIVTWMGEEIARTFVFDVFARRFNFEGDPLDDEFIIHTTAGDSVLQSSPALDVMPNGDWVSVWVEPDGSSTGIFARQFNADGTAKAAPFQVNQHVINAQDLPDVGVGDDGNFVVAWQSNEQTAGLKQDIYARRFGASGTALSDEFQVNIKNSVLSDLNYSTGNQLDPVVDVAPSGIGAGSDQFAIVWRSETVASSGDFDVYGNLYTRDGVAIVPSETTARPFRVNTDTVGAQNYPDVTMLANGRFQVVWASSSVPGASPKDVYAKNYSTLGQPGLEELLNSDSTATKILPRVGVDDSDNFLYVWQETEIADVNLPFRYFFGRYNDAAAGFKQGDTNLNPDADSDISAGNIAVSGNGQIVYSYDDLNAAIFLDSDVRVTRMFPRND